MVLQYYYKLIIFLDIITVFKRLVFKFRITYYYYYYPLVSYRLPSNWHLGLTKNIPENFVHSVGRCFDNQPDDDNLKFTSQYAILTNSFRHG